MAFKSSSGAQYIANLKELCLHQLILIGYTASNQSFILDSHPSSSTDPRENFIEAVKVLDAYLTPVWDEDYKSSRDEINKGLGNVATKLSSAYKLLQVAMLLMIRTKMISNTTEYKMGG